MPSNLMNRKWSILELRHLCDKSLFWFVRIVNKPPKNATLITQSVHLPHCKHAQNPLIKRKGHGMPRDWLKTITLTCWKAIWKYLKNPEERQLLAMENERIAMAKLNFISKQILTNQLLRKIYGDILHLVDDSWIRKNRWSQTALELPRKGVYSEASITAIGIGGAAQSGHYDSIYLDDIIGKSAMDSILIMETAFTWIDNVNELLVNPDWTHPDSSEVNIIGSPWGPGDAYDYIKSKYPEYQWLITPCLKDIELEDEENIKWIQNPNVDNGESNWLEQFPTDYYRRMAANPEKTIIFWAQHMCNPQKSTGINKFEIRWLKTFIWDDRGEDGLWIICEDDKKEFPLHAIPLYGMIDPGGFAETKLMKKGSRNAILIGGQPVDSIKKFVTYTWAGKFKKPSLFLDEIFKAHKNQSPRGWRIDTVGTQPYIYRDILEEREKRNIRSLSISPLPKDKGKDSKDSDIQALINPMANGEIYVNRTMYELMTEIKQYPHGLTKDLLDMLAKLNRVYWSRRPVKDSLIHSRKYEQQQTQARNTVSGY